jgi:hydroxypyruvate reductase
MKTRSDPRLRGRYSAEKVFLSALKAADPRRSVKSYFKDSPLDISRYKNIFVIGAGKAVCPMARAVEELYGERISGGCVVTKYGHGLPLRKVRIVEAAHPVPDRRGWYGARELLRIASRAEKTDLVITLLSGGASALLAAPDGITLGEKKKITKLLVNSGATIAEINSVRKHLSKIKGGQLMKAVYPASSLTLIVSDVVGDDLSTIASGPTVPDPTTFNDALGVLKRYGLLSKTPPKVLKRIRAGVRGERPETPKPGDKTFKSTANVIVASNSVALEAAKKKAVSMGYNTLILSSSVTGPTRFTADLFSDIIREVKRSGNPVPAPACLLLGGETTLKVAGGGMGGRNQEFALATAARIDGLAGVTVLAAGTDGTDGPTDVAGAFADSTTLKRAKRAGADYGKCLRENDSYRFFKPLGDLFITGPTGTNVMDIVVAVIE